MHAKSYLTIDHPRDCSPPGASSTGFSRQEYYIGLPFPSPGDLPDLRMKSASSVLAGGLFTTVPLDPFFQEYLTHKKNSDMYYLPAYF